MVAVVGELEAVVRVHGRLHEVLKVHPRVEHRLSRPERRAAHQHEHPEHRFALSGAAMNSRQIEICLISHSLQPADAADGSHCLHRVAACRVARNDSKCRMKGAKWHYALFTNLHPSCSKQHAGLLPHTAHPPRRVSAPSRMPSTPSSTAFATSVASARVGRGAVTCGCEVVPSVSWKHKQGPTQY